MRTTLVKLQRVKIYQIQQNTAASIVAAALLFIHKISADTVKYPALIYSNHIFFRITLLLLSE